MSNVVRAGLVLGLLVEVWTAVVIAARWHIDPTMMLLFFLVIPLQAFMVVMALRKEAATASYLKQVANAVVLSTVAAVVVFAGAILLTTVVFPNYFDELRGAGEEMFRASGKSPEEIAAEMAKNEPMYNPVQNALTGSIATVLTGLVIGLVAGPFVRKKKR